MLRIAERQVACDSGSVAVVVTPHGDLDLASLAELHAALGRAIRTAASADDRPRVVLDLAATDSLHPVVLGVLLDARRRCRAAGGVMALVVTAPEVSGVLAETDVAPLFETATELEAALRRVSRPSAP